MTVDMRPERPGIASSLAGCWTSSPSVAGPLRRAQAKPLALTEVSNPAGRRALEPGGMPRHEPAGAGHHRAPARARAGSGVRVLLGRGVEPDAGDLDERMARIGVDR